MIHDGAREGAGDTEAAESGRAAPTETAAAAGLRYVSDAEPGIRRRRAGTGFSYRAPDGTTIRDPDTLRRIRSLAIPPAYTDVWICPDPNGHLQATGLDARGRKQYRYHPRWRDVRDALKYDHLRAFGQVLPRIRARTDEDLKLPGLPRRKVLAAVVRLLERSMIRVGNDAYRRENGSYGLTTLRDRHAAITGATVRFQFRGKSGKHHSVSITDRRLARVVKRCQELPGQHLFQYVDESGQRQTVDSADVNAYLKEIGDADISAKDFRTWAGTLLAARFLRAASDAASDSERKHALGQAVAAVASRLGNTKAVCRACYIHPVVLDAYLAGQLPALAGAPADPDVEPTAEREAADQRGALTREERALLALLASANGQSATEEGQPTDDAGQIAALSGARPASQPLSA